MGWGFTAPALLWTLAFFVAPFLVMGAMSFAILEGRNLIWAFHLVNYIELATRPYLWRAVIASIEITLSVTLISVVLAYPLAATIAFRVPRHLQRLVLLLAVLPFWTSYVVRSYAWLLVLAREGVLNQTLIKFSCCR